MVVHCISMFSFLLSFLFTLLLLKEFGFVRRLP